jgi:CubicO group peptidase (beta-lactamase class C family)
LIIRTDWARILCGIVLASVLMIAMTPQCAAQELEVKLDSYLTAREQTGLFSGGVLVLRDGKALVRRGFGKADFDLGVPNTPDMLFRIGSVTKPLTASVVMALEQEGKLNLDDSICKYLAQCPVEWRDVHIRHLLTHTSGVPNLFNSVKSAPLHSTRSEIDAAILKTKDMKLLSRPGEKYSYNNFGYMLLGYVIEVASSKYWDEVLQEKILGPLKMTHTLYDDVWAIIPNRVRGYTVKNGILQNIIYKDHSAYSVGGLLSTVDDMARFVDGLVSGHLFPRSTVAEIFHPFLDDYGLGWQITTFFGVTAWDHSGGIDGFSSNVTYLPDDRTLVVFLSNIETEPPKATVCDLVALLEGKPHLGLDRLNSTIPSKESLTEKVGKYSGTDGVQREITLSSGKLYYQVETGSPLPLDSLSSDVYMLEAQPDTQVEFQHDPQKGITGITVRSCGELRVSATKSADTSPAARQ